MTFGRGALLWLIGAEAAQVPGSSARLMTANTDEQITHLIAVLHQLADRFQIARPGDVVAAAAA